MFFFFLFICDWVIGIHINCAMYATYFRLSFNTKSELMEFLNSLSDSRTFIFLQFIWAKNVNKFEWKRLKVFEDFICGRWYSDQRAIKCLVPWISYRFYASRKVMHLLRITLKNEGKIPKLEQNSLFIHKKKSTYLCTIYYIYKLTEYRRCLRWADR